MAALWGNGIVTTPGQAATTLAVQQAAGAAPTTIDTSNCDELLIFHSATDTGQVQPQGLLPDGATWVPLLGLSFTTGAFNVPGGEATSTSVLSTTANTGMRVRTTGFSQVRLNRITAGTSGSVNYFVMATSLAAIQDVRLSGVDNSVTVPVSIAATVTSTVAAGTPSRTVETSGALASGATYTGSAHILSGVRFVDVEINTDQSGTFTLSVSQDNSTYTSRTITAVTADTSSGAYAGEWKANWTYFKIVYVNGGTAQTRMRIIYALWGI